MVRLPPALRLGCYALALALATPAPAGAGSKVTVALIGGAAPGGGVFAGPGFTGWPSAAGQGWVAFRGQISGGTGGEALVVARMTGARSQTQVATIGQESPGGEAPFERCAGTFRQFLGQPVVNADGEVAFLALVNPPRGAANAEEEPATPVRAGIFVFRGGQLRPIACAGTETDAGRLDLVASLDPADPTGDIAERSPALNDRGDIAFLAGVLDADGHAAGGALVLARLGAGPVAVLATGDRFEDGEVVRLGPPAINEDRLLAFHAIATTDDASDGDGLVDGIFTLDGRELAVLARDGLVPPGFGAPLSELMDPVSLDESGNVAFLATPLADPAAEPEADADDSPGVLAAVDGQVLAIAWAGLRLGTDTVSSVALGPGAGGALAPPVMSDDGRVVFFATLNGGGGEAIVFADPATGERTPAVHTLGQAADETPAGGVYNGLQSAPALDAAGALAFRARVAGGGTSEALVHLPPTGRGSPILVGDAAPLTGFFAGRPFSAPLLNDRGEVVFRAFVARGPGSVGIFRWRDGELGVVVRAGDSSPNPGRPPFLDIVGDPSVNAEGTIAFAAVVRDEGRGIYVADGGTLRAVVRRGDPAPGPPGTTFSSIGAAPAINGRGQVAFRAATALQDDEAQVTIRQQGLFLADGNRIDALVWAGTPSPQGLPFAGLRDPVVTDAASLVFRAPVGELEAVRSALFVIDRGGGVPVAVEQQDLGGGLRLAAFSGDPAAAPGGTLAFLAGRLRLLDTAGTLADSLGPTLFRATTAGIVPLVSRGDRALLGGTFRTFGQPSVNDAGHVAFRATFQPDTGGTGGVYVATGTRIEPAVLSREISPGGERFSSFGARPAINAADEVAFSAGLSAGEARTGLFLTTPARLLASALTIRLGGTVIRPRDRVRVRLRLLPGRLGDGVEAGREPVVVALHDTRGPLWSVTVPPRRLKRRGGAFVAAVGSRGELSRVLRALRLRGRSNGVVQLWATSAVLDLTRAGVRELVPPLTLVLQVGDDSATVALDCPAGGRVTRCSG